MFKKGDAILHPQHGAGTLTKIKRVKVEGVERRYYCINLTSDWGTLMIPVEKADESGLRELTGDMTTIEGVLESEPQELSKDYRLRQSRVAEKIHSGDTSQVAQALRDLAWRAKTSKLSLRDEQLRDKAQALLSSLLALQPDVQDIDAAGRQLNAFVNRAMEARIEEVNGEA